MSLSPLYPSLTNDLHVSIATSLHQSFLCLHPHSGIVHHLSGLMVHATTQTFPYEKNIKRGRKQEYNDPYFLFSLSDLFQFNIKGKVGRCCYYYLIIESENSTSENNFTPIITFITHLPGFIHPTTRINHKLLGPCFKTGQYKAHHYYLKAKYISLELIVLKMLCKPSRSIRLAVRYNQFPIF